MAPPIDNIGVTAVDDYTVKVTLTDPTSIFPTPCYDVDVFPVPKHVIDKRARSGPSRPISSRSGPYVMTEWKHNQSMTLEPNPNYWGSKPTVTKIVYSFYQDETAQGIVAYENDEIDFAEVPATDFERVKGDPS